jgi:hypothetical protein
MFLISYGSVFAAASKRHALPEREKPTAKGEQMAKDPTVSGRKFLVLELVHESSRTDGCIAILATIPGRQGSLSRRYAAPYGVLDESQLEDLAAAVGKQVQDAVVTWAGIQGRLQGS